MAKQYYLVLDLGTTGVKAFVFDVNFDVISKEYLKLKKSVTPDGRVEQSPKELLDSSIKVMKRAILQGGVSATEIISMGIATQRETVVLWDRKTGKPVMPAIVWQDQRTASVCKSLKKQYSSVVEGKTGLEINPYFSATKIAWALQMVPQTKKLLASGDLLFGTPDSWLLWNLLDGNAHYTDYTNASRTLLYNTKTLSWDADLLQIFGVPNSILPKAVPSSSNFGLMKSNILGAPIPIQAVVGDQQSSLYAAGVQKNTTKITYGTGAFIMQIIGANFKKINGFFTTLTASAGKPLFALEAKVDLGAADVDKVLGNTKKMHALVKKLADKTYVHVKKLPKKPKAIVIDGGITQEPHLKTCLEKLTKAKIENQLIYDGTAFGVAKLLKDFKK